MFSSFAICLEKYRKEIEEFENWKNESIKQLQSKSYEGGITAFLNKTAEWKVHFSSMDKVLGITKKERLVIIESVRDQNK